MAPGEEHQRLFVGCRRPAKIIVFDTISGKEITELPAGKDADDIFYDVAQGRIYISSGGGFLDIFEQTDPDHYKIIGKMLTAPGARTSLLVPEQSRIYLAVPRHAGHDAEIRVYSTGP